VNPAEKLFLQLYLNHPGRYLLRFSFIFMVLGIVLSVGILAAGLNLFEGYERALRSLLLDSFPHISVQSVNRDYLDQDQVAAIRQDLLAQPEVASAIPTISFNAMAYNGSKVRGSLIRAYDPNPGGADHYSKYVSSGSSRLENGKVIVGHYLAQELGLALGDTLRLVYPQLDRITPLGMYPSEHSFIISGIYKSGYYEYDRSQILCTLADAQSILYIQSSTGSIEVKLKGTYVDDAWEISRNFDRMLGNGLTAFPVANSGLLRVVRMQKWLIFVIFCFLVLIAGINIISAVTTQILDRKNEIAVLKTLGATPPTIRQIFQNQMLLVCLGAIVLGQLFGYLLSWLVVKQDFYHLKGDVYFIDRLELYVSPLNQIIIFVVAAILAVICIRIPLRRIDRMQIIDLLRNP